MDSTYWDIAAKQLQGKATPAEQEALQQWLAQDPAHRQQLAAQQRLWELTPPAPAMPVDTDAAWLKVRGQLRRQPQRTAPQVVPMYRSWARLAASVALLIGLAWLMRYFFFPYFGLQVVKSGGAPLAVVLPDSSHIWLNRNSLLAYDPDFDEPERLVKLEGEAFFEVQRDPQRPFSIEAKGANTQVLGTSFNLRAYPQEQTVELTVATGKVAFTARGSDAQTIVMPGFGAVLHKETGDIRKYAVSDENAWAWRTGKLQFNGRPLREVLLSLEQYYQVRLALERPELGNCRFTGTFEQTSLEEVLQVLAASLQLHITKQNEQTYTLTGEGCG